MVKVKKSSKSSKSAASKRAKAPPKKATKASKAVKQKPTSPDVTKFPQLRIVVCKPGEKPEAVTIPNTLAGLRGVLGDVPLESKEVSVGPWACELWYREGSPEPKLSGKEGLSTDKDPYFLTSRGKDGLILPFIESGALSVMWALRSSWADWEG